MAVSGAYRLTGVSDLAAIVHVRRLLDRGYPEYSYPMAQTDPSALNYIAFAKWSATHGVKVERVKVGSQRQVVFAMSLRRFRRLLCGIWRRVVKYGSVWASRRHGCFGAGGAEEGRVSDGECFARQRCGWSMGEFDAITTAAT